MQGVIVASIAGAAFGAARIAGAPLFLLILCHALTDLPPRLPHEKTDSYAIMALFAIAYTLLLGLAYLLIPKHWARNSAVDESVN